MKPLGQLPNAGAAKRQGFAYRDNNQGYDHDFIQIVTTGRRLTLIGREPRRAPR